MARGLPNAKGASQAVVRGGQLAGSPGEIPGHDEARALRGEAWPAAPTLADPRVVLF
jgi:hypothetical protein